MDSPARPTDVPVPALIPFPARVVPLDGEALEIGGGVRLLEPNGDTGLLALVIELLDTVGLTADDDSSEAPVIEFALDESDGAGTAQEAYSLRITSSGARVTASSRAGLFYGAQTLIHLLSERSGGAARVPAMEIVDSPRFGYRGMMLDVARHFFDVRTVKRVIDRIAMVKLNHLHLHLSDDQGWRLHIDSWPLLTERGASGAVGGASGGFYSHDDFREIVAYARERFVTIVPEIDLPGHTHAAIVAYPELAPRDYAGPPDAADPSTGMSRPYDGTAVGFSTVDVTSDTVYRFVGDVAREVASLSPGPYLHLGGDESLTTTESEYLAFLERASTIAAETGKTLVFWHEAGRSDALPPGSIGQFWDYIEPRDDSAALTRRFVEGGGSIILSPADAIYLDMKHTDDDPRGLVWADGPTSLERAYGWEPLDIVTGLDDAAVLGIEAPLWSETIDSLEGIDALAFPRLLAAAEIAWSPSDGAERSWESFRRRVAGWQHRLDALGIGFTPADGVDWS